MPKLSPSLKKRRDDLLKKVLTEGNRTYMLNEPSNEFHGDLDLENGRHGQITIFIEQFKDKYFWHFSISFKLRKGGIKPFEKWKIYEKKLAHDLVKNFYWDIGRGIHVFESDSNSIQSTKELTEEEISKVTFLKE